MFFRFRGRSFMARKATDLTEGLGSTMASDRYLCISPLRILDVSLGILGFSSMNGPVRGDLLLVIGQLYDPHRV